MPFKPGDKNINRKGRPKGAYNRSTEEMKLTIARAVNHQLSELQSDLDKIREDNPAKALELAMKLMEYTIPKLKSMDVKLDADVKQTIEQIKVEVIQKESNNAVKHKDE